MKDIRLKKFEVAKIHARERGIEFLFTYQEWITWWEFHLGPDWLKLRGKLKHQYCMARKGDTGPYHPDNVECKTVSENCSDKFRNGRCNSSLNDETVLAIYYAEGTYEEIAYRFNTTSAKVGWIKLKKAYRWATENEPDLPKRYALGGAKLSREQVREIYVSNDRTGKLAKKFGIEFSGIIAIRKGKRFSFWTKDLAAGNSPRGRPSNRTGRSAWVDGVLIVTKK